MLTLTTLFLLAPLALASAPSITNTQWKKTLFLDDFTGSANTLPSSSNWILQTGTQYSGGPSQWGTGEVETYTTSTANVRQAGNGSLLIIPQKSSSGQWTSARIETRANNFAAPVGGKLRIEARIKLPSVTTTNGQGYWPAFWALGGDFRSNRQSWPGVGEIDIMENVNAQTGATNALHCGTNPGGPCNEPNGLGAATSCQGSSCLGNFHIYEIVIDRTVSPERLNFWVDRVLHRTLTQSQLGATTWKNTIQKGFYVILNVAIGGSFPNAVAGRGTPNSSTVGGRAMEVDYVAVWST
ncbi:unnamed protein product [Zymoseptoria tritici ST99CH_3D7]|uniref:Endo-beta-1,3-glucanase n=2 Tax=Zymoseptoria tritici TaxID=1047171 RepID=F9XIE1_ZYMTI|nr:putative endo-beta-1,3-glucanase [Zymoseptoria tritici IPO323]EGP84896.1 putative endo-beta-1,3-glucanase [Zymoseptoria tritici IPO323]SMQ53114.1 unnamed protein product [Zymoseptoria tritici ST99CH_3D7]